MFLVLQRRKCEGAPWNSRRCINHAVSLLDSHLSGESDILAAGFGVDSDSEDSNTSRFFLDSVIQGRILFCSFIVILQRCWRSSSYGILLIQLLFSGILGGILTEFVMFSKSKCFLRGIYLCPVCCGRHSASLVSKLVRKATILSSLRRNRPTSCSQSFIDTL